MKHRLFKVSFQQFAPVGTKLLAQALRDNRLA